VIVKCVFGIPVDYKEQVVPVWDSMKEKLKYKLKESDFLKYLFNEGRCNVNDWRDIPERGFGTSAIFAGRRGGKSQVISAIAGTCLRDLLNVFDPQEYYNLVKGSKINFTMFGTDEDSSTRLYEKLKNDVNRSPFFTPYIFGEPGATSMSFLSEADRQRRSLEPSIEVAAFPCTTRSARGPSSYFLALDEFQHFRSSKDANSDALYAAATPSTSNFPSKDYPGYADSRILMISSPLNKLGKMYEMHKKAMKFGIESDIFTIRLSTIEMNPELPAAKLREELRNNPDTFPMEFEGKFSDGAGSYVAPEKFAICVNSGRKNIEHFDVRSIGRKFFWAVDYGTKNDATALAIGHLEMQPRGVTLNFDYIDRMMVGEKFTGPGVQNGARVEFLTELDLVDVISWLVYMHRMLPCYKGVTDQHGGTTLKQLLQINGITTMELVHLTDQINSRMYFDLRGFIDNQCANFPDVEKFKTEFNLLEAEFKSKYVLKVEAPSEKGSHDDMADATAMVAWEAQKWLEEEGKLDLDPTGRSLQVDPRIANPVMIVNPNDVSMADLHVMARMSKMGDGLLLPAGYMGAVQNPYQHRRR
jgi:hypothetical protein